MSPTSSSTDLTPLGQHAFIHRPLDKFVSPSLKDPTVVVLFGWMSAKMSHLKKYVSMYREIYPESTIILVRSNLQIFWSSTKALEARFGPVIEVLEALGCFENHQRVLIHSFSNGGALHLLALNRVLSSRKRTIQAVPTTTGALIIDSAPGGDTLERAQNALTTHIKNRVLRWFAKFVVRLVYCLAWVRGQLLRRSSPIQTMMLALRCPHVLPWIDAGTPRLYLYSKVDEMVPAVDIEEHARLSELDGLDVRRVCFEKSPHVAHARFYPEQYWTAVREVWTDACARVD